jgi:hypothetical protein
MVSSPIGGVLGGVVIRVNSSGFMLDGRETWGNISKYADPKPAVPPAGARVRCTLDRSGYVRAVEQVAASRAHSGGYNAVKNAAAPQVPPRSAPRGPRPAKCPAGPREVHHTDGRVERRNSHARPRRPGRRAVCRAGARSQLRTVGHALAPRAGAASVCARFPEMSLEHLAAVAQANARASDDLLQCIPLTPRRRRRRAA